MPSTKEVVEHHVKCFGEGDLQGILADYAPDAVVFTPDGPLKGTASFTALYEGFFAEFGQPGTRFELEQMSIDGDYAYLLWSAETADNVYDMGTDTIVVRDGRIVAQSYARKVTPKVRP
jgi:ketosteroid isomerase-like protein